MVSDTIFPGGFRAAAVEVDITPPVGHLMAGYAARQEPSVGVHDPLIGQVLYLSFSGKDAVLLAMDAIGISLELTQRIREQIHEQVGIPYEYILLACSHTHSGPSGLIQNAFPGVDLAKDPEYSEEVVRKMAGAVLWAGECLQPAMPGLSRGSLQGLGSNRNNPEEAIQDREVIVLQLNSMDGEPIAVLMNYGCHPTVLGYQNRMISADYPGAARSALCQLYPRTRFMFTNGAAGDVSTRFTRRRQDFSEVTRMGHLLAGEVLKCMQMTTFKLEDSLLCKTQNVVLPFRRFPTPEEAQAALDSLSSMLESLKATRAAHGEIRKASTRVEGATAQLAWSQKWKDLAVPPTLIQVMRIGSLALVAVPGEVFTRTALEIKAKSPAPVTAIISYANDYRGYFPDPVSIEEASYEALVSPYDEKAVDLIVSTSLQLINEVF